MQILDEEQMELLYQKLSQLPPDGWHYHAAINDAVETRTDAGQHIVIEPIAMWSKISIDGAEFLFMRKLEENRLEKLYHAIRAQIGQNALDRDVAVLEDFLKEG